MKKETLIKKLNELGFATEFARNQGDIDRHLANDVKNTIVLIKQYLEQLEKQNVRNDNAKEKKYRVDIEGILLLAKHVEGWAAEPYGDTIAYKDDYIKELTEKEIRDCDERFWLFAEEVDE